MDSLEKKLIAAVKQHKCLYNLQDARYKNFLHKEQIWATISESLNVDAEFCKKKWRSLRDMNRRSNRRTFLASGSAAPMPKKQWRHTEAMKFLGDIQHNRSKICNIPVEVVVPGSSISSAFEVVSEPSSPSTSTDHLPPSILTVPLPEVSPLPTWSLSSPSPSVSDHQKSSKKRKRYQEDEELAVFLQSTRENISTLTRTVAERNARNQEPINRYFSVLAQEIVNANVPLSVQRSIFEGCRRLVYSSLDKYELSEEK